MIELSRPLVFLDLETTGVNINQDKIIEIALIKRMPDNSRTTKVFVINPGVPIPEASSAIHGFKDDDVKGKPFFKDVAKEIKDFIQDCDLAGYNSNKFDIPLLAEEFTRVGMDIDIKSRKFIDVAQIFMKMERRTLEAAYKFYCDKKLENAHAAEVDTLATLEILDAQIARYDELESNVDFLHNFSKGEDFADFSRRVKFINNEHVFAFGKYKDKTVVQVFTDEPQYYDWMMRSDFAQDTKAVITEVYNKMKLSKFSKK
jgi:DNA polymerase III subunit epsilon